MDRGWHRHWGDRLADVLGAVAVAAGWGGSALLLAPRFDWPAAPLGLGAAGAGLGIGWLLMRAVPAAPFVLPLAPFEAAVFEATAPDEPMVLDDPLPQAEHDSRVVQLFAPGEGPTAGEIKARIDRHLAETQRTGAALPELAAAEPASHVAAQTSFPPDATEALYAALEDIRRSLQRG